MTDVTTISTAALRDMLARHELVTVLDVRPAAERAEWAIPGSQHIDAYERLKAGDPDALDTFEPPVGAAVVTVCAAGRMSLRAAELLAVRGVNVRSLAGGMKPGAWPGIRRPLPCRAATPR